ncbi:MAG: MarR family transcriptional regulator [Propionibacteriaceae bacterium]|nr:MarR family transcriptional regulator [Propionibacteriaceae bacterium]
MSDAELLQLANDLRVACQIISRRVRFEGTREIAPHQASVLSRLRAAPCTVGELASADRVSAPSMTRTVNCLVERGLVTKQASPADGRQVLVALTAAGHETIRRAIADRDCWMVGLLEGLDAEALARLRDLAPLLMEVARS